jgi:hypothetical protein
LNELFHALADPDSAAARREVMGRGLKGRVSFRNVHYPEVLADLTARGGTEAQLPALWDGERLYLGLPAVLAALGRMAAG